MNTVIEQTDLQAALIRTRQHLLLMKAIMRRSYRQWDLDGATMPEYLRKRMDARMQAVKVALEVAA